MIILKVSQDTGTVSQRLRWKRKGDEIKKKGWFEWGDGVGGSAKE